ncbi:quinone oxidoreductase family protein [Pseudomonas batumici]|uniref:Quinone oxidoreductase n=1 Tax=Pseudomonas batumici TaxID=226910 RepID=A0A0C2I1C8_9PSED|nr:quinone oxidoreductase [Pseudomonas batumici]KIH83096.1 Quinone oxidoreductase [Pseudomonas batumici]
MAQHIRISKTGAPSVLQHENVEVGEPGAGQVRLKQEAVGVNFVDTMFRDGTFPVPLPFTPGVEGAGVIEAVGAGVTHVKVGDRVGYWFALGAYADERLVEAEALVKLPAGVSSEQSAAIFTKGLSAWALVKQVHVVKPGETVLVHAAAGGVGSLVALWAQALGAKVIATVGSPHKMKAVRERGIEQVLDVNDADLVAKVRALNGGHGVDVVYELVGATTFTASVASVRDGGDLVHLGNASGPAKVDKAALEARAIRYVQPVTGQVVNSRAILDAASRELFAALQDGIFGQLPITRYPLREVGRAHEDIAARRVTGSVILMP